jgi:hypothetical protein
MEMVWSGKFSTQGRCRNNGMNTEDYEQLKCREFVISVIEGLECRSHSKIDNLLSKGMFILPNYKIDLGYLDSSYSTKSISLYDAVSDYSIDDLKCKLFSLDPFYEMDKLTELEKFEFSPPDLSTIYKIADNCAETDAHTINISFSLCKSFNAICSVSQYDIVSMAGMSNDPLWCFFSNSTYLFIQAFDGTDFIRWSIDAL